MEYWILWNCQLSNDELFMLWALGFFDFKNILLILSMEFQSQHRQLTEIQRVDLVLWTISNRPPFCWFVSLKENVKFTKYISTNIEILHFFICFHFFFSIFFFSFTWKILFNFFFLNCELTERFNKTNCNWFSFSQLNLPQKKFPLVVGVVCICICFLLATTIDNDDYRGNRWIVWFKMITCCVAWNKYFA